MPVKKNTQPIALKGYTPPDPPEPAPELKPAQITKVKNRVKTLLAGGPLEHWYLTHLATHHARVDDGIAKITAPQVREVLTGMTDDFEPGYGGGPAPEPEPGPSPIE